MKRKPVFGRNLEKIKEENAYLKMKLMLEKGAQINSSSGEIPPEVENEFLKYIMEFERQSENPTMITVFDRIGKPTHFKPVDAIREEEMEDALTKLRDYLIGHQIDTAVCSPNVSAKEFYRFIVEELFYMEIPDIRVPGMMKGFIYDEFHPDPVFDNEQIVVNECLLGMLSTKPVEKLIFYRQEELQLNDHFPLSHEEFLTLIGQFKSSFDSIDDVEITEVFCQVNEKFSFVRGNYSFLARWGKEEMHYRGKWLVNLELDSEDGQWLIFSVQIDGINF